MPTVQMMRSTSLYQVIVSEADEDSPRPSIGPMRRESTGNFQGSHKEGQIGSKRVRGILI